MSRSYQEVGLKEEACDWLDENVKRSGEHTCPCCGMHYLGKYDIVSIEEKDSFYGMGPRLRTMRLKNDRLVKEVVQAEPWSSGPVAFFCLKLEDGTRMFEWTEEEISERL